MNGKLLYLLRRSNVPAACILLALWICAVPAPAEQGAADVTGTWDVSVTSQEGTSHPSLLLRQDGEKITGTYSGKMGDADLEGTLKGDDISFTFTLKFQEVSYRVTYTGKVAGDTMKGSARFGSEGSGSWSAKRRKSQN